MSRRLSRRLLGLVGPLAVLLVFTGSAHAYTLSLSGGSSSLAITPNLINGVYQPLVVTGAVSGSNIVFTPAADSPLPANCTNSGNTTTCPTTEFATSLTANDAYVVNLTGVKTATLILGAYAGNDQFTIAQVQAGTLMFNPANEAVAMNVSGSVGAFKQFGSATDTGTLSLNLAGGATTGILQLVGPSNYIYAPASMLTVNSAGGNATITSGGSISATGGGNLIHAVSTTQTINGGGSSAVDFLDISTPLTITLQDQASGGAENALVSATGGTAPTKPTVTNFASLTGGSGANTIIASAGSGADTLNGGPGPNTFFPNSGPDQINGGTGNDNTIDYAGNAANLTVNLAQGTAGPTNGPPASQVQLTNVQNAIVGDGTDTITAGSSGGTFSFGNGAGDTFTGGAGTDTVTMGNGAGDTLIGGQDASVFTVGTGAGDTLTGGAGASVLTAPGPNAMFVAGFGQNTITGGGANATLSYANRTQSNQGVTVALATTGASTGNGQPGENDSISGIVNVIGGAGYNILTGDSANNILTGGPGGNRITGGSGQDTLNGGSGDDIINSGSGSGTVINGNGGDDSIDATTGTGVQINCGAGATTVLVNSTDTAAGNCSTVTNPSIVPTTTTSTTPVEDPCTYVLPGQTCGGKTEPYPELATSVEPNWKYYSNYFTQPIQMTLDGVQKDSGLTMTCSSPTNNKAHRCPFRSYFKNFSAGRAAFSLLSEFKRQQMSPGTTITIKITNPLAVGRYVTFRLRANNNVPTTTKGCLNPKTGAKLKCPAGGYYTPPS